MPKVQIGVSEQQPDRANSEVTGVLLREFDLVNTRIQLSGALTAAFTDRIEAVKNPLMASDSKEAGAFVLARLKKTHILLPLFFARLPPPPPPFHFPHPAPPHS